MGKGSSVFKHKSYKGDEYYTMRHDVELIADQLLPIAGKVWCPFDTDDSFFPEVLRERGYDVVNTCSDFFRFKEPPEGVTAIISNPPFSMKKEILNKIVDWNIKYALLLPILFLSDGYPLQYGSQFIFFSKRMRFFFEGKVLGKPLTNCYVQSNGLLKNDLHLEMNQVYTGQEVYRQDYSKNIFEM